MSPATDKRFVVFALTFCECGLPRLVAVRLFRTSDFLKSENQFCSGFIYGSFEVVNKCLVSAVDGLAFLMSFDVLGSEYKMQGPSLPTVAAVLLSPVITFGYQFNNHLVCYPSCLSRP